MKRFVFPVVLASLGFLAAPSHVSAEFLHVEIDLSGHVGRNITLDFRLTNYNLTVDSMVRIDNITLDGVLDFEGITPLAGWHSLGSPLDPEVSVVPINGGYVM